MTQQDQTPMTTGAWFLTLFVLAIPLVNLIMYIVWACGAGNINRATFCRASLLWGAIILGLYVLLFAGMALTGTAVPN